MSRTLVTNPKPSTIGSDSAPDTLKVILLLIVISAIPRLVSFFFCDPVLANDSTNYYRQAMFWATWDITIYRGWYPPLYPLFLLSCFFNWKLVFFVQSILGIATSVILFKITYRHTNSLRWAFVAGLINSLSFNQLIFERVVSSETLARLMMVATFWQFQSVMRPAVSFPRKPLIVLGLMVALTFFTRVNLLPTTAVFLLCIMLNSSFNRPVKRLVVSMVAFLFPVIFAFTSLCSFNKCTIGTFTPSAAFGWAFVCDHADLIKLAPDEYKDFRDPFLGLGDFNLEPGDRPWQAYFIARKTNGLGIVAFSRRLAEMSLSICMNHPMEYLECVPIGWSRFFQPLSDWHATLCGSKDMLWQEAWKYFGRAQTFVTPLFCSTFFIASLSSLFRYVRAGKESLAPPAGRWSLGMEQAAIAVVLLQCICQGITSMLDCPRYAVPVQPLMVLVVVCFCRRFIDWFATGRKDLFRSSKLTTTGDTIK